MDVAEVAEVAPWYNVWVWATPLIVLNTISHVAGLVSIQHWLTPALQRYSGRRRLTLRLAAVIALGAAAVTVLHAVEAMVWAVSYLIVSAIPDTRSAMLFSIDAMTTYGHSQVRLPLHWRLMGTLEALNGMILFGLTTAFLFATLQSTAVFGRK